MKLVFATNNNYKLQEIRSMLPKSYELLSLDDINFFEILPETHETLEENSLEKAEYLYNKTGYTCFADDSGLEVVGLNGKPGVYSARYAGEERNNEKNIALLLDDLQHITNRSACFRTVIALVNGSKPLLFEGKIEGRIALTPSGNGGFGYDPIFIPFGFNQTFAEMPKDAKNKISHRAQAFNLLINYLNIQTGPAINSVI